MTKYDVLHPGPYLTIEDIRPHINRNSKHCIYSVVQGTRGRLKINHAGKLMSVNGTRMPAVLFDRGVEVMIVTDGKCPFVIAKDHFERLMKQANQPLQGE